MNPILPIVALIAGVCVGGIALWVLFRGKVAGAVAETRAQFEPQVATLTERVNAKDQQVAELQSFVAAETDQKSQLAVQLQEESNARATAEEKCHRIPDLELQVKRRDDQIAGLQQEVTLLKSVRAELQTTVDAERRASEEKLALLQQAEAKLSDAFHALAAEALKNNNQSFLALAKQSLE